MRSTFLLLTISLTSSVLAPPARANSEILGAYPEFETSGALVLGFSELIRHHPKTLVEIVKALEDRIPIVGVVADGPQYDEVLALLNEAKAPTQNLDLVQVPVLGMWIRDYGPIFVRLPDGKFVALDAQYPRLDHRPDDWAPRYLAGYFRLPVVDVPLRLNGGNLLANGEGWVFTTSQILVMNAQDGPNQTEIGQLLRSYYGATDWMILKPLKGEPTQHIDMFLTLVGPNVAVLGSIDSKADPENARLLDESAALLARVQTRSGPMKVVRIPMPGRKDGKWRTYTNVIHANDTLLIPSYPDVSPELDRQALRIYSELLPDRRIVQIHASTIIEKNGSLHCISINVPELGAN